MAKQSTTPQTGEPAPSFELPATGGKHVSLDQFAGKKNVVLYFYPKDETAGCTKQACGFRDHNQTFAEVDTVILGVSGDDMESHESFVANHGLPFPLLSDTDFSVSTTYGAYKLRERDGKQFMGIERTTFLIDKDGVVRKVYPNVQVDGHVDELLKDIADLG